MNFCTKEIIEKIECYITNHKDEMLNELMELVRVPSIMGDRKPNAPFGEDCKKAIESVEELFQKHGLKTKKEEENRYVLSYFGENSNKQIGIFSHADVVPVDDDWLMCKPFLPVIKDGYMFGRGCNDDKSGIIQALYAVKTIEALNLPLKSQLVMFAGGNEETGMADIKAFVKKERMPDVSLVPDGEYPYYSGEKNIVKFEITSENRFKNIKKFDGGTATNIILGNLLCELEYTASLFNEIFKLCENDNNFKLEHNEEVITIKAKGKSNHLAHISDSVNAALITAKMLLQCKNICDNDKLILSDIIKFIDGGFGEGFGIKHSDNDFGKLVCGNGIAKVTNEGKLKLVFDTRSSPHLEINEIFTKIKTVLKDNWDLVILRDSKGYLIDESKPLPTLIKNVYNYVSNTTDKQTLKTSGGTYARMLKNAFAIGNIAYYKAKPITLPDGHGGYHQSDEKMSIDGFFEGLKILVCLILEIDSAIN